MFSHRFPSEDSVAGKNVQESLVEIKDALRRDGQRWDLRVGNGKLRYRCIKRNGQVGGWRRVKGGTHWTIQPGGTSGLPQNLFNPMQEAILSPAMEITKTKRTFERVRGALRRGVSHAAILFGCDRVKINSTHVTLTLADRPLIDFLIIDFHRHNEDKFFKKDKHGATVMQKDRQGNEVKDHRGHPRPSRALGKLSEKIRGRRERVGRMERKSKAALRWTVVVFAAGNIWLVPAKAREKH